MNGVYNPGQREESVELPVAHVLVQHNPPLLLCDANLAIQLPPQQIEQCSKHSYQAVNSSHYKNRKEIQVHEANQHVD